MNWTKFQNQFHPSWHRWMQPFIESKECDNIYKFLKFESQRGKQVAPLSQNVFRCFYETSYDDLKVVMVGMCPYHSLRDGECVADGLLMGCSTTNVLQPSLQKFYDGIEKEIYKGLCVTCDMNPDVSFLAKQGVLMYNAALTTEINKAGSHIDLWEPFTKYLFEEVLAPTMAPVLFLGKDAAKYEKYVAPFTRHFTLSHPASASYKQADWDTEGVFTKINKLLKDNNNLEIDWMLDSPF
jgi:uracil-DNA glycosylase